MSNKKPVGRFKKGCPFIGARQPKFKPVDRLPVDSAGRNIGIVTADMLEAWFKHDP